MILENLVYKLPLQNFLFNERSLEEKKEVLMKYSIANDTILWIIRRDDYV